MATPNGGVPLCTLLLEHLSLTGGSCMARVCRFTGFRFYRCPGFITVKLSMTQPQNKTLSLLKGSSKHPVWLLLSWFHLEMVCTWWPTRSAGGNTWCWPLQLPPRMLLRDSSKQYPTHPLGCWTVMVCNSKVSVCDPAD